MIDKLCDAIAKEGMFSKDFYLLRLSSLKLLLKIEDKDICYTSVERLLQTATTFSLSNNIQYRHMAYEIAINSWKLLLNNNAFNVYDYSVIFSIISLIFCRLGNFPADQHFTEKYLKNETKELPLSLAIEKEAHRLDNIIKINEHYICLTDAQLFIWSNIVNSQFFSISAPTSAGKSYVFLNYILWALCNSLKGNILYIVPTRALISQVIMDIQESKYKYNISVDVTEIPYLPDKTTIFVLTQERTQILLDNKDVKFDIIIADEIQNINSRSRGVILQSVLDDLIERNTQAKFIFGAPFAGNISLLNSIFRFEKQLCSSRSINESSVLQNMVYIDIDKNKSNLLNISMDFSEERTSNLFSIDINTELIFEEQILANISYLIGKQAINIIYGSEQVKCEKISRIIRDIYIIENNDTEIDIELKEFAEFIRKEIHKDYSLSSYIESGVAYHYGRLPSFIRKGIERLFRLGKIKFLACTSTLLQGVNLPAQNIFILNPCKGKKDNKNLAPLSPGEFWNLAGRAGRLTKDFDGNIFMINVNDWLLDISSSERSLNISPSFYDCLSHNYIELYNYIIHKDRPSGVKELQHLENTFMKLYCDYHSGTFDKTVPGTSDEEIARKNELKKTIQEISKDISLPVEIISKNKNVSAFVQDGLYKYFIKRINSKEGCPYLIPKHPMKPWDEIIDGYKKYFYRLHNKFFLKHTRQHEYYAPLALIWMRGVSYAEMLKFRMKRREQELLRKSPDPNVEARNLFKEIEYYLRFVYVKLAKCYHDILVYSLETTGNNDFIKTLSPIHLFLELGASSVTTISIISLGISRTSASILSREAPRSNLDHDEALRWLTKGKFSHLPRSVNEEISELLFKQ